MFPLCMEVVETFYWRRPRSGAKLSTTNCNFTGRFYSVDSPSVCDNPTACTVGSFDLHRFAIDECCSQLLPAVISYSGIFPQWG